MRTRLTNSLFFIILIGIVSVVFPCRVMAGNHARSSWYIGFGVGGGIDARFKVNSEDITFDEWLTGADEKTPLLSMNFKVGATLSPKTLLGFDGTLAGQMGTYGNTDARIQINNYFLMLTYFPVEEGFFIRAGSGLTNFQEEIEGLGSDQANGYGVLGGIGYAFWLGKRFNLTINLDHSRQFYSGGTDVPDNSQFTILYLGFDWY